MPQNDSKVHQDTSKTRCCWTSGSKMESSWHKNRINNRFWPTEPLGLDSNLLAPPRLHSGILALPGLDSDFLAPPGQDSCLLAPPGLDLGPLAQPELGSGLMAPPGLASELLAFPVQRESHRIQAKFRLNSSWVITRIRPDYSWMVV